jgi:hypothetical protein
MKQSVRMHDYPVIQGIFLVVTIFVMLANMLADLVYSKLDPRITAVKRGIMAFVNALKDCLRRSGKRISSLSIMEKQACCL